MSRKPKAHRPRHPQGTPAGGSWPRVICLATLWLMLSATTPAAAERPLRHGKRFDTGAAMTQRAEGAPEALDRLSAYRCQWDVTYTEIASDGSSSTSS